MIICIKGNNMTLRFIILFFIVFTVNGFSQGLMGDKFLPTRQDTLRGSITPEREWWDLTYYHLDIKVEPSRRGRYSGRILYLNSNDEESLPFWFVEV
jgi:hypothetical protein